MIPTDNVRNNRYIYCIMAWVTTGGGAGSPSWGLN
jgi:hypothetical protein